jgi:hypothetical protein
MAADLVVEDDNVPWLALEGRVAVLQTALGLLDECLGSGRVVASETEVPNVLVNMV